MKPLAGCKLYALVGAACLHGRAQEVVAQQLCGGGADLIQLRAKNSLRDEVRRIIRGASKGKFLSVGIKPVGRASY